jgi:glycerol kinase
MFSAAKLASLLDETPGLRQLAGAGDACAGTVDSWLAYKVTGGALHVTDAGQASRTLLFDIDRLAWSDELLDLFGVPRECLPEVGESSMVYGEATEEPLRGRLLAALAADSHAAMFGLGCVRPGTAKATYGTGTSLASTTGRALVRSANGLATTLAWLLPTGPTYALEGNIISSGATVEWVGRLLGLHDPADVERLAGAVTSSEGVHIVPAFSGLGAPYWEPRARAKMSGLSFSTGPSQVARAALESVAFQVADLVGALRSDFGHPLSELRADGGATRSDLLMQLQADLLGVPIVRTPALDAAALGAAFLAGLATGLFSSHAEVEALGLKGQRFEPSMDEAERSTRLESWHRAVSGVLQEVEGH